MSQASRLLRGNRTTYRLEMREAEVHIEEIGAGPALLFIHGCPGWGGMWRGIAERVVDRRVLLADLPGYGKSPPLDGDHSFERVRTALEDALLERGVTETAVVGFSIGGYRALELALAGRVDVTYLLLIGAPADFDDAARAMRAELVGVIRSADTADTPFLRGVMTDMMVAPGFAEREPSRFSDVLDWLKHVDVGAFADEVGGIATMPNLLERIAEIDIPVHVLHGALDAALPLTASEAIVSRIKGATLEVLPGIGHSVPIEAEQATLRAIASCLSRVS
jgi:pimeloyl-ACP methyl ester carboxylesterase